MLQLSVVIALAEEAVVLTSLDLIANSVDAVAMAKASGSAEVINGGSDGERERGSNGRAYETRG